MIMKIKQLLITIKQLLCLLVFLVGLNGFGQSTESDSSEISVVKTADDTNLKWGPCPPFMPNGCAIAILHGDPSKNNLDVLFKVPAKSDIPNHWHNSAERMILISGELQVTYKGEDTQTLKAGSYAYGPSKKPHTAKCSSPEPCVLFIAFEEPLDAFPLTEIKD